MLGRISTLLKSVMIPPPVLPPPHNKPGIRGISPFLRETPALAFGILSAQHCTILRGIGKGARRFQVRPREKPTALDREPRTVLGLLAEPGVVTENGLYYTTNYPTQIWLTFRHSCYMLVRHCDTTHPCPCMQNRMIPYMRSMWVKNRIS